MATSTLHPPATPPSAPVPRPDRPVPVEPGRGSHADRPDGPPPRPGRGWASPLAVRGSLLALLAGTALLYLWGLSASGYANSFYSAAVQAGSQSWKAFFYGSLDASNAITVDKPPASLWLMALSVRVFGLSSWSILAPQALLGVATVGVLYASVRRTAGHGAALLAGAVLALTPAAALMFRFNNPDALLVFLLTLATYATLRATEIASRRWLVVAGVLVGLGFLTKMLQAFLVLPAFVLVYLLAAPTSLRKRLLHLLAAFAAMLVSLGWWVAVVELVPASWRPYVGGSQSNSVLELVFGYNGLGRLTGAETGSVTGGAGGAGTTGRMWGDTGITRLFDGVSGGMIAWLIPAALVLTGCALVALGRRPRTDPVRANLALWAGWLLVTGLTFSFMAGIYHDYYTVALAPAVAALVALGAAALWTRRTRWLARGGLAAAMALTTVWGVVLMSRASGQPYESLTWVIGVAGTLATAGMLLAPRLPKALAAVVLALAMIGGITGPAAYAIQTAATAHTGSIVTAGPVTSSMGGPGGGGRGQGQGPGGAGGQRPQPGANGPGTQQGGTQQGGARGGGGGGILGSQQVSAATATLLETGAESYTWVAATTGAQSAAGFQLATGEPVMAIGGFNGSDPSPTLEQFQALVAAHKIHYYLGGTQQGGQQNGGSNDASAIAAWVAETFTATTVGGTTVYDLSAAS